MAGRKDKDDDVILIMQVIIIMATYLISWWKTPSGKNAKT